MELGERGELGAARLAARPQPGDAPRVDHGPSPRRFSRSFSARRPRSTCAASSPGTRSACASSSSRSRRGSRSRPSTRPRSASGKRLQALAWAQIALDQITWTAIVYVTGGATSGATSFYALTCLVGAILVGLRGAAVAAGLGIAHLRARSAPGFHSAGCCRRPTRPRARTPSRRRRSSIRCSSTPSGMTVVALLGGYLAERLRLTGGALAGGHRSAPTRPSGSRSWVASPPGSRTRSATRSGRSPARSRCCANRRRSRTRTGGSATSCSARPGG